MIYIVLVYLVLYASYSKKMHLPKVREILTETWETSETSPEIGGDDISFWSRQFCSNKVLVSCLFPFSVQIYIVIDHLH